MSGYSLSVDGMNDVLVRLHSISALRADAVIKKSATEIFNRGKAEGGTPFKSGELRNSLNISGQALDMEVGYTKEYAPHVEYGHRKINGGYVQGQYYLRKNAEKQQPILMEDMRTELRKVL